ncbi:CobW family GTP-binding protein [Pontiella agarivorans]|uniref:CobW family GTP-binding protein n=1 Tax=Pontiella agarivorans TaxID=3038953 RepID=A0ABU5N0N2_9BACT|nr:CobW family GTP-binding protein [Pontiella agarivorans]MDZ8119974.1 CobW family GTP-binding protein [Pontiella agarivorans]
MIPICLITGFLGTGKTTLLKRIVEQNKDRKWIYLVNEFSALDVDGAIVSAENPEVVSIPGGSIFCKCLVTEFIGQMSRIHEEYIDTEGVIIEASGMADPRVIADMLKETGLGDHYELSNIISIVEPRSFLRLIHTLPNIIHQVEAADLVLLNKCDLFNEQHLLETEAEIQHIQPGAHLRRCEYGQVNFPIFGTGGSHADLHGEYAKCRDPRYSAFALELNDAVDPECYKSLILEHEDSVYRVKGYLRSPDGPVYFDYSKAEFSLTPASPCEHYGLAWICEGDKAEKMEQLARAIN